MRISHDRIAQQLPCGLVRGAVVRSNCARDAVELYGDCAQIHSCLECFCRRFKSHILHAFASRPSLDSNDVLAPNCSMRKMPGWVLLFILAQSWWARALLAIALWGYLLMLLGIFMASHPRGEARNPRAPRTPS
jgi:hypothetical protein